MESTQYYPVYYTMPAAPKKISCQAVARSLFIEEKTFCFTTGYYLKPYMKNEFRLLDCTMGGDAAHEGFLQMSIPTANFLNTSKELVNTSIPYPNGYPTEEQVVSAMQKLGIQKTDTIVLYGQPHRDSSMTRVWHILNGYGFEDVTILDGGLLKFSQDYPVVPGQDYTGPESKVENLSDPSKYLIKMDEIVEFALGKKPNMQLVDCRGEQSFNGNDPDLPEGCRQGHVPGAINISADKFINAEDDTFLKYPELVRLLELNGVDSTKDIAVMCKTGVSATVGYMGMLFAQFPNLRLYDGSWTEYGSNDTPSMPIVAPMPMYYQPQMIPTPHIIVLPSGQQYMAIKDDQAHYPVYQK